MLADALGKARVERRELQVRAVLLDDRRQGPPCRRSRAFGDDRIGRVEAFLDDADQDVGHVLLDLEPHDAAAPPPLDRGAEIADQVLGLFLDLDVAVAHALGRRRRAAAHTSGTDNRSCAGSASPARCSATASPGMRMKRGTPAGSMMSSRMCTLPRFSSKISEKPRLGMNGNGCAGSIACGVRSGKICSRKYWSSQASAFSSSGSCPMTMTSSPASASRSSRQTSSWLATSRSASSSIAVSCWRGGHAVGGAFLDAQRLVRLQAGDADHEEFVEVAGRDRQEAQPLEQRMMRVARFLQHAPVEGQPAQLAIEIALLGSRHLDGRRRVRR